MKPKDRRDRLFKTSRPNIREMQLVDQQGYTKDMATLWGAYRQKEESPVSQSEFAGQVERQLGEYTKKWVVEDNNSFCGGYGPVGIIYAQHDGWGLEPYFEPFAWASSRNILRSVVSFLQMMRYDKEVGIVNVYSQKDDKKFFNHVSKYGVLRYATKIPDGTEDGDKYIYYIRGRK